MNARGTRRPHARTPRPRNVKIGGGGGSKRGSGCSMSLPLAIPRTVLALAQLFAVEWQIRGAR